MVLPRDILELANDTKSWTKLIKCDILKEKKKISVDLVYLKIISKLLLFSWILDQWLSTWCECVTKEAFIIPEYIPWFSPFFGKLPDQKDNLKKEWFISSRQCRLSWQWSHGSRRGRKLVPWHPQSGSREIAMPLNNSPSLIQSKMIACGMPWPVFREGLPFSLSLSGNTLLITPICLSPQ